MSYKLIKPYTEKQRADFVVNYNHKLGLNIEETPDALFALEKNEILLDNEPIINPNYDKEEILKKEQAFKKDFFETSLGWIKRKVTMKDGSIKDFLSDLLLPIKAGLDLGRQVEILTYKFPDFSVDFNNQDLQEIKYATTEFVYECLEQTVNDFGLREDR